MLYSIFIRTIWPDELRKKLSGLFPLSLQKWSGKVPTLWNCVKIFYVVEQFKHFETKCKSSRWASWTAASPQVRAGEGAGPRTMFFSVRHTPLGTKKLGTPFLLLRALFFQRTRVAKKALPSKSYAPLYLWGMSQTFGSFGRAKRYLELIILGAHC